jgi:hypothetical protein
VAALPVETTSRRTPRTVLEQALKAMVLAMIDQMITERVMKILP